jgi:hypothetical protein
MLPEIRRGGGPFGKVFLHEFRRGWIWIHQVFTPLPCARASFKL